ncbi:MAG TPA: Dna2/Cas4 domain-containing protein [Candidatus Competibacteraceae bacterium]|nr:Dna2/Cas4 domain-containing protein [Candidatus Competibacteraceae bacterium]
MPEGALFYGKTRRRRIVAFDTGLRALTIETVQHIRRMIEEGQTPAADYEPRRCDACLLKSRPAWARGLKQSGMCVRPSFCSLGRAPRGRTD